MKDHLDPVAEPIEPGEQALDRHDLDKLALGDVAPFIAIAETVDDDEVGVAGFVELGREDRADKPAAAGND